jgi:hypothetical protein
VLPYGEVKLNMNTRLHFDAADGLALLKPG